MSRTHAKEAGAPVEGMDVTPISTKCKTDNNSSAGPGMLPATASIILFKESAAVGTLMAVMIFFTLDPFNS